MKDLMYCNNDNNFYFASQPNFETYEELKKLGVKYVINLRGDSEGDFTAHREKCEELGIIYVQMSFLGGRGINKDSVDGINKIVSENKNEKFFVHCASANRTGGWYAIYLNQIEGLSIEDAIEKAFNTNNMRPPMDDMVRDYLE